MSVTQVTGDGIAANEPWHVHRENIAAVDTLPITGAEEARRAANLQTYDDAIIEVAPVGGANPTIDVLFWSDALEQFVPEHTNLQFAGIGADAPFQVRVPARGRRMFVAVTTLASGSVTIRVAGARTIIQPPA